MTVAAAAQFQLDVSVPTVLGVGGELSFDTAADAVHTIQSALQDSRIRHLDLARVTRNDSAGLACVLAVVAETRRRGRSLVVVNMPVGMQALAQVCEVDQMIG